MFDRLLGQPLVTSLTTRVTRGRLRILGMHGVPDLLAFERQLQVICERFQPVGLPDVLAWLDGRRSLAPGSVWITFDDGERSAVVEAAELLARYGVPATMFLCPAFIEGTTFPWWEVVASAVDHGAVVRVGGFDHTDGSAVTALKRLPDQQRREIVASLPVTDEVASAPRATLDDLRRWRELGGHIGNHTWDHPCLDQCGPDAQRRQIDDAAAWLDRHGLWDVPSFAYPNGNWSPAADAHLRAAEYPLAILFDHHLVRRSPDRFRISRLSLDAGAPPERTRAVTSGLHSGLFRLRRRIPDQFLPPHRGSAPQRVGS